MGKILITPRSLTSNPPDELSGLATAGYDVVFCTPGKTPDEAELIKLLPGCVGWLAGVEPVSEAVIRSADSLRVISRNGTGVDSLPLAAVEAKGIRVERAVGANATGVAELAIGLMLSACRHIPAESAGVRDGGWPRLKGREIEGATVGVVGMGAIGRKVATTLVGLGADVVAYDPFNPALGPLEGAVRYVPLDDLFAQAGMVTFHCPMTEDGRPILSAARIASMPEGAIVVNTARAGLVDDGAMIAALDQGQVASYATDVFDQEPPEDLRIASHPKVIATSHVGGLTDGSVMRATRDAVNNLLTALEAQDVPA
tara:strand:+ start:10018 stop:10959 length:942 start_codon:yes stop_codon:yes gene_type:complete